MHARGRSEDKLQRSRKIGNRIRESQSSTSIEMSKSGSKAVRGAPGATFPEEYN